MVALSAVVHALRGETIQAESLRLESYDYMVSMGGAARESWQRNPLYCSSLPLKALGDFTRAREMLERALQAQGQPIKRGSMAHEHDILALIVDTAAQMCDAAGLAEYLSQAEALAKRDNHRLYLGIVRRARGVAQRLAGEFEAARSSFGDAKGLFEAQGTRWQLGRTFFELGELENQTGDKEAARLNYTKALALFEEMQAQPYIEQVRKAIDN